MCKMIYYANSWEKKSSKTKSRNDKIHGGCWRGRSRALSQPCHRKRLFLVSGVGLMFSDLNHVFCGVLPRKTESFFEGIRIVEGDEQKKWLTKDELNSVKWLPADAKLISHLRCIMEEGEALTFCHSSYGTILSRYICALQDVHHGSCFDFFQVKRWEKRYFNKRMC